MFWAFEGRILSKVVKNHRPTLKSKFSSIFQKCLFCCLTALFAATASAQVEINPLTTWREQTGENLHRLKVEGDKLYGTAVGQGLTIYDITNPLRPAHLITFKGEGTNSLSEVWDVEVKDGVVYLSDRIQGIIVLDVSKPTNIVTLVSSFSTPDSPLGLRLVGNLLYVATDTAGLIILDVSEARSGTLRQVGQYNTPGMAHDVQIVGGVAYVSDNIGGIQIIDVSNPTQPVFLGEFKKERYYSAVVHNNHIYAVGRPHVLTVIDATDLHAPKLVTEYGLPATAFDFSQHVQIRNNAAYITDNMDSLVVVDVSNPAVPVRTSINRWGFGLTATAIVNDQIWVGGGFGLTMGDLSDPLYPGRVGVGVYTTSSSYTIESRGPLNFIGTQSRVFRILNTTNPEELVVEDAFESNEAITYMKIDGDRAYLFGNLGSNSKLTILDISDVSDIKLLDRNQPATNIAYFGIRSFEVKDNLLIATSGGKDITIMDVSDPHQPVTLLDGYRNGRLKSVSRQGHYLYAISSESKLEVYDITTPSTPRFIGQSAQTISGQNVLVEGENFFAWNNFGNLQIADISNPTNPVVKSSYSGTIRNVKVVGEFAYLAEDTKGLTVINISDPANPTFIINYPHERVQNLTVFENTVTTIGNTNGTLQTFETFGLNQTTPSIVPRSFGMVDGQPQFEFRTGLPVTYTIESTADFQTWVPAGSVTATNSRTRFSPTATSASGEFYRVRSP